MGINGLLPHLKCIQVSKHLSEFAGQRIAVDAYVWLHRGVMTCATELATGKATHKYVDYAMHRVRILRHHKIEPYIVFDGGPLPAKKGTESDRKQRRDDCLNRANALAAQGKHGQARDLYAKCVDVTPQMAFQFIKALKAEHVEYVVAPYEADAQMAYLERAGIVDAILTEDSDLLVFGCQNVLFKFDSVANTVISISRKDFGAVCRPKSEISLVDWSDVQFRAMAILSGCDYLQSIPGIGVKTACSLLRKWKTPDQVVRAIMLEGKKSVPKGYMNSFCLADKCFQHQRVFCPQRQELVYLTEVTGDWDDESEAYVGGYLEVEIAQKLARGDLDPVTLLPMTDINPDFAPRLKTKDIPFSKRNGRDKGKGKASDRSEPHGGILSFFGTHPLIPTGERKTTPSSIRITASNGSFGKSSGKRTLAQVMDAETSSKKQKHNHVSRFFASPLGPQPTPNPAPGPSRQRTDNKENECIVIDDDDDVEAETSLSTKAQGQIDQEMELEVEDILTYHIVDQEEGYISPVTESCFGDVDDLSSPVRPIRTPPRKRAAASEDRDFHVEAISSPPSGAKRRGLQSSSTNQPPLGALEFPSPHPSTDFQHGATSLSFSGPDLWNTFPNDDEQSSDIDGSDEETAQGSGSRGKSPVTPASSPPTPIADLQDHKPGSCLAECVDCDPGEDNSMDQDRRTQAVISGWRKRWSRKSTQVQKVPDFQTTNVSKTGPTLSRRETNITPAGRHIIGASTLSTKTRLWLATHATTKATATPNLMKRMQNSRA